MHYNSLMPPEQPQLKLTECETCPINLMTLTNVLALCFIMKIFGGFLVFP